jgi:hypothetical protein
MSSQMPSQQAEVALPPQRPGLQLTAGKLILIIVVGIVLAVMLIRGIAGFANPGGAADSSSAQPAYQLVPCATHPEAIGCGTAAPSVEPSASTGDPTVQP